MNSLLSYFWVSIIIVSFASCINDVNSIPPRTVTLKYNWEAADIAGRDTAFVRISHQAGAMDFKVEPHQKESVIQNVIGNLIVHETPELTEEKIAVVDQTYVIPTESNQEEIHLVAPE